MGTRHQRIPLERLATDIGRPLPITALQRAKTRLDQDL
jgi:hypothetical protein